MKNMSVEQKLLRREARYHGKRVQTSLELMRSFQHEADRWKTLVPEADERQVYWTRKANREQAVAVEQARKAAHFALKTMV